MKSDSVELGVFPCPCVGNHPIIALEEDVGGRSDEKDRANAERVLDMGVGALTRW
jgi:hypothetical protein